MRIKFNRKIPVVSIFMAFLISVAVISCKDDYIYDNEEPGPELLGASIYDYMQGDGHFTYFLRLIDDLNYKEVLSKTGSMTLFPVRDDAFERFFQGNVYGVRSYENLTPAQKRYIMNVSVLNMAYLSNMLSNVTSTGALGSGEGLALRHITANTYLDSISYVKDEVLFAASPYWQRFQSKGLYLVDNESSSPMVHFTPLHMAKQGITPEDFYIITGKQYEQDAIYVNGIKIIQKDIFCKNGYIHVLEDLMLPAKNMAQIIRDNGQTALFNKLMDKFCLPLYEEAVSNDAHNYYNGSTPARPLINLSDSVFVKRYFTESFKEYPSGKSLEPYGILYYDPTDNDYSPKPLQQDMGAMFVPTDQAMNDYLNSNKGRYLKEAYGNWENIPTSILSLFIKNHQKRSFMASLPHSWATMTDETSYKMNVSKSDIIKSYIGSNGTVYISNAVYPPIDYQCVYGPVLSSVYSKAMNWGIQDLTMKFYLYLRSMENMYNLIIPVDEAFDNYRDPVAWAKAEISQNPALREIWSFRYMPDNNMVYADVYYVDASGNKSGLKKTLTDQGMIRNRMKDIIDMHIVVGEKSGNQMSGYIDDGKTQYAQTKGGATLKFAGGGENVKMIGGGDIEQNIPDASIVINPVSGKKSRYDSDNGRTYFIDKILQDPVKSVFTILGEHAEYTAFFNLLKGDDVVFSYFQTAGDKDVVPVFDLKQTTSSSGMGSVVNSFGNFRYTVFIPTEAALNQAFAQDPNLYTWDEIAADLDHDSKKAKTLYLLNFLKNHFMDNSIYIDGKPISNMFFESAARNEHGKFYKLVVNGTGSDLTVQGENGGSAAKVVKTSGLYNLMARDYIVDNKDYLMSNNITSSSRAVIHLIDKALKFE